MGYMTGLGELLLYEIYQIIQPPHLLALSLEDNSHRVINNIYNGSYVTKLFFRGS